MSSPLAATSAGSSEDVELAATDRAAEEIAATGLGKETFVSTPGRLSRSQSFSSFSLMEDGGGLMSSEVVCGQPPEEGDSRG